MPSESEQLKEIFLKSIKPMTLFSLSYHRNQIKDNFFKKIFKKYDLFKFNSSSVVGPYRILYYGILH